MAANPFQRMQRRIRRMFGGDAARSLVLAAVIGITAGFAAVGFRALVSGMSRLAFRGPSVLTQAERLPWWVLLALPVAGLLVAWALTRWGAQEVKGHGVPEVMDAVAHRGGRIRPRVVLIKAFASACTIGAGGSVGREGPIVQIGSALGSSLAQLLRLDVHRTRLLVACGAAAGIAATFNAPIAGVVFAVEIILGSAAIGTFSPIVVSSVVATAVSRWFLGRSPAFEVPAYALSSPAELVSYALLGLVAGALGVGFIKMLYGMEDFFEKLPVPPVVLPIVGGLVVGALGLLAPGVYGIGYETIEKTLHDDVALAMLAMLVVAKVFATSITLAGGGSGGIFAPSLFLGATLGGGFGLLANQAAPWPTAGPGAYALVGMGAVVAATTHAPLTAIIIIFELTGTYTIILPLMLACITASVFSVAIHRESIYTLKLVRRGVRPASPSEARAILATPVRDLLRSAACTLPPDVPFQDVVDHVAHAQEDYHYVVDDQGKLLGVIALHEVKSFLEDPAPEGVDRARDMMSSRAHALRVDETLETCLARFALLDLEEIPVVDGAKRLAGVISRRHILGLYNRELLRLTDLGVKFVTHEGPAERHDYVELPPGHVVDAIPVPARFVGKTLRELDLRGRHALLVVGLRRPGEGGSERSAPDPALPLAEGTVLVVEGPKEEVEWLRGLGAE